MIVLKNWRFLIPPDYSTKELLQYSPRWRSKQCLFDSVSFNFLITSKFSSYWTHHLLSCQIWRGVTGVDTWALDVVLGRRSHMCGRWVWTRSRTVCRWSCFMALALGWGCGASTWMPSLQTDQFMPWISLVSSSVPSFVVHPLCLIADPPHFLLVIQIILTLI